MTHKSPEPLQEPLQTATNASQSIRQKSSPPALHEIPALVINLETRPDRWQHVKLLEAQLGLRLTRIPAVNGMELEFDKLSLHPMTRSSLKTGKAFTKLHISTRGALGCFFSHRNVWKQASEADGPCLILEDDAEASAEAREWLPRAIEAVHNDTFDLVLLGIHRGAFSPKIVQLPSWVDTGVPITGSWAYVISPQAARQLWEASHVAEFQSDLFLPLVLNRIGFVQCFHQAFFVRGTDIKHLEIEESKAHLFIGSAAAGALVAFLLAYVYVRLTAALAPA